MTPCVHDMFEIVNINENDGKGWFLATGYLNKIRQNLVERTRIIQTRILIRYAHTLNS